MEKLAETPNLSENSDQSISIESSESYEYYWYHGNRIYLKIDPTRTYQVYDKQTSNKSKLKSNNLTINVSQKINLNQEWSIREVSTKTLKASDSEVLYQSPCYIYNNEKIGVSHLVYVQLKHEKDISILQELAKELNVSIIGNNEYLPLWYTLYCTNESKYNSVNTSAKLYETGLFKACEPGLMMDVSPCTSKSITSSYNDPYYSKQWNLKGTNSINWDKASDITLGSSDITIGIYDSGIDTSNSDLTSRMISFDVLTKQYHAYMIYDDHATAVAGITSAIANNNYGITGIAPECTVLDLSFNFSQDPDLLQLIANGFCIAGNNCDVINCSWHIDGRSSLIEDAIDLYCHTWGRKNKGAVIVFASGNSGTSNVSYPGSCKDYIINVGWMTKYGKRNPSSNYGYLLDLVAPGDDICTTDRPQSIGYGPTEFIEDFAGTSAAAPHVTGVIALMLSVNPNLTDVEVKEILEKTAQKVGGYGYATYMHRPNGRWNNEMGYGLVDSYEAVKEAQNRL